MTEASDAQVPLRRNLGVALLTLLASSGTLVCCVLPAAMVALGAGAALAGLVTAVPQLVWLSEHKAAVFGVAGVLLGISGVMLWRARTLPCPADRALARACVRMRRASLALWWLAAMASALGPCSRLSCRWEVERRGRNAPRLARRNGLNSWSGL